MSAPAGITWPRAPMRFPPPRRLSPSRRMVRSRSSPSRCREWRSSSPPVGHSTLAPTPVSRLNPALMRSMSGSGAPTSQRMRRSSRASQALTGARSALLGSAGRPAGTARPPVTGRRRWSGIKIAARHHARNVRVFLSVARGEATAATSVTRCTVSPHPPRTPARDAARLRRGWRRLRCRGCPRSASPSRRSHGAAIR